MSAVCAHTPLWEQFVPRQISCRVSVFVIVGIFGLHSVGGQQHSCFWWAIDVIIQDGLFDLGDGAQSYQRHTNSTRLFRYSDHNLYTTSANSTPTAHHTTPRKQKTATF